jgi:hypothetical protein
LGPAIFTGAGAGFVFVFGPCGRFLATSPSTFSVRRAPELHAARRLEEWKAPQITSKCAAPRVRVAASNGKR